MAWMVGLCPGSRTITGWDDDDWGADERAGDEWLGVVVRAGLEVDDEVRDRVGDALGRLVVFTNVRLAVAVVGAAVWERVLLASWVALVGLS